MNFDPLPDADNAAVGSHHGFDFFRRHLIGVSLFSYGSNAAFGWGHHFRTLYKINAYITTVPVCKKIFSRYNS